MKQIEDLIGLVSGQVDEFITDVLRPDKTTYTARENNLQNCHPDEMRDGDDLSTSNNPSRWDNIIDSMNTPFDHIDRIILQDLSSSILSKSSMQSDSVNYFRDLFTVEKEQIYHNVVRRISASDGGIDFSPLNSSISSRQGGWIVDSFTYTPFIDYSTKSSKVGIYQDEWLTKYNTGFFDVAGNQIDEYRNKMSSTLFTLNNLDDDLYNAKMSFRDAIKKCVTSGEIVCSQNGSLDDIICSNLDGLDDEIICQRYQNRNVYIRTMCEHLLSLFSRLSNIRMCYEVYGLKSPHSEWEGILALDVWYQLLYRTIDCGYAFREDYIDRNPMVKLPIKSGSKVEYNGTEYDATGGEKGNGIHIFTDGVESGYVLLWDQSLFSEFKYTADEIRQNRDEYVTPRGVLKKIATIVNSTVYKYEDEGKTRGVCANNNGDFDWFAQRGKVYSDHTKSPFTKYANLHLGRAWQVMTPRQYSELFSDQTMPDGMFVKPSIDNLDSENTHGRKYVLRQMVNNGVNALNDAFKVMREQRILNIYNSRTKQVEVFKSDNADYYSQGQCAIVIERVFSALYKYLQFKSTTGEEFSKHINIDCGYKYLTTESLSTSDNPNCVAYHNGRIAGNPAMDKDEVPYLRYLKRLDDFYRSNSNVLNQNERTILGHVIDNVLSNTTPEWMYWDGDEWSLCPLCSQPWQLLNSKSLTTPALSSASPRVISIPSIPENPSEKTVNVMFRLQSYMGGVSSSSIPSNWTQYQNAGGFLVQATYRGDADGFNVNLSDVELHPTFTYNGETISYELLGYSTSPDSNEVVYSKDQVLTNASFKSDPYTITLYAVWKSQYIIEFSKGDNSSAYGNMVMQVVDAGVAAVLNPCGFVDNTQIQKETYYENGSCVEGSYDEFSETVSRYEFDHWEYVAGSERVWVDDGGLVMVPVNSGMYPVITLEAQWRDRWNVLTFNVEEHPYCDVLIDAASGQLVKPSIDPVMTNDADGNPRRFIGWNKMEGSILDTPDRSVKIVCGDHMEPIVCGSGDSPILCMDGEMTHYSGGIEALISSISDRLYNITYNYVSDSGELTQSSTWVNENSRISPFHVHQEIENGNEKHVFRYWKLSSGNLAWDWSVLSDLVFDAVYDVVQIPDSESSNNSQPIPKILQDSYQQTTKPSFACPYISTGLNREGRRYCTYPGIHPIGQSSNIVSKNPTGVPGDIICSSSGHDDDIVCQDDGTGDSEGELVRVNCSKINALNRLISEPNDFNTTTWIEIDDVATLIKALLKVNIDIAHREYYLKIDEPNDSAWWYGSSNNGKFVSFEPTIEYKFSNFHASNQVQNGKLVCTVQYMAEENVPEIVCNDSLIGEVDASTLPELIPHPGVEPSEVSTIVCLSESEKYLRPVNRELVEDTGGVHYSDFNYAYDYCTSLVSQKRADSDGFNSLDVQNPSDRQRYYSLNPLCLYEDSSIQSPFSMGKMVRTRLKWIPRTNSQVQTFTSIVKKYRPLIVPEVRDIFNDCVNDYTKYEVDKNNDYGIFGWCTIPSKTMVDMEYNEGSIIVPSSYDHHNRVGGQNFLQMDADLADIYKGDTTSDYDSVKNTWYYIYNRRDWTYFLEPFFNIKPNSELYTMIEETYQHFKPSCSDHINGVIFEPSNKGRVDDSEFGNIFRTCDFLARWHHNERNLTFLSQNYGGLLSYAELKSKTMKVIEEHDEFNSVYGSQYDDIPDSFLFSDQDIVDDYNKTSSYVSSDKYSYNLGQLHSIDDGDEDSVWMYITMVSPIEDLGSAIEIEDVMPFVFWWSNRGQV